MFVNTKILKSLMKEAYKCGGLKLAQTEERIYIAGNYWEMDVEKKYMPKQVMAQIIDLAGEIPDIGIRKRYYRVNGKDESQDAEGTTVVEAIRDDVAEVTSLLLIDQFGIANRILQLKNGLVIVNNVFIVIADPESVDYDNEEWSIEGPFFEGKSILWQTNAARFRAWTKEVKGHERLLSELTMLDLSEDLT